MNVKFRLSTEFQKAEFARTAAAVPEKIEGTVIMTPAQAAMLVDYSPSGLHINTPSLDGSYNTSFYCNTLDVQEAFNAFVEYAEKENQDRRERKEKEKQRSAEQQQEIDAAIARNRALIGDPEKALKVNFHPQGPTYMRVDQETYDYIKSVREETEARKLQQQKEGRLALQAWGLENGSELLRLRIEEKLNWQGLGTKEWVTARLPEGYVLEEDAKTLSKYVYEKEWDIKNASLEQLRQLQTERNLHPEIIDIMLRRKKFQEYCEPVGAYNDDELDVVHQDYIEGKMITPDGSEVWVSKFIGIYSPDND